MLNKNIVRKRVLSIINERIDAEQNAYEIRIKEMDKQHRDEIKCLKLELKEKKVALLDDIVLSIIGKII